MASGDTIPRGVSVILSPRVVGDGLLAQYLHFVRQHEAPRSYHVATFLTLFSALLERRLVINRGYTIRANLYTLLLGPPASRKTFGTRIVQKVFATAGYELDLERGNATDEGLVTVMADKEERGLSPVATVVAEEFSVLLGDKKYQTGMCDWLCQAYDGGPLKNTRRVNSYSTKDSFLSIVAGTTPKTLLKITQKVVDTGLSSRVWIIAEKGQELWTSKPVFDLTERELLASKIQQVLDPLLAHPRIFFDPGKEADAEFDKWYMGPHREFATIAKEGEDTWAGRRHDHAMRAAVLLHLIDGGSVKGMSAEAIQRGVEFVESFEPSMFAVYKWLTATQWGRVREHVIEKLREKGVMEMRHLMAIIARMSDKATDETNAIRALASGGILEIRGTGGKALVSLANESVAKPDTSQHSEEKGDEANG